jgi:mannosyltransferase OCH1-like enzyme
MNTKHIVADGLLVILNQFDLKFENSVFFYFEYMIPKKIFQIWIGPKKPPTEWMQTWKDMNPTWEYNIITNDNIPEIKNRKQFDMMEELAGKADILRVELLYNHG